VAVVYHRLDADGLAIVDQAQLAALAQFFHDQRVGTGA
jgi:hypothetical protein